jgi:hypothetical protein
MDKRMDHFQGRSGNPKKFTSVTAYLKNRDFQWLREDMGFFDLPEKWDFESGNDNGKPLD